LCDITLACTDGQVEAHKVVLSACSPVFKDLIKRHPNKHPLIYLRAVKLSDLAHMLSFMYQGEINIPQEELQEFLLMSQDLRLAGLSEEGEVTEGQEPSSNAMEENQDMIVGDKPVEAVLNSSESAAMDVQEEPIKEKPAPKKRGRKSNKPAPIDVQKEEIKQQPKVRVRNLGVLANVKNEPSDNMYNIGAKDEEDFEEPTDYLNLEQLKEEEEGKIKGKKRTSMYLSENGYNRAAKEGKYSCELCEYTSISLSNFTKHVKSKHLGIRFPCPQCEYQSSDQSNLKKHIKSCHNIN